MYQVENKLCGLYAKAPQKLKRPNWLPKSFGKMGVQFSCNGPAKSTVNISNAFKVMKVVEYTLFVIFNGFQCHVD
jgi:hypothetical protein